MFSRWFTKPKRPHILFVCTANLCRSPMAEAICRAKLDGRDWKLSSAGFFADHPLPPVPEVLTLLHLRGLSTEGLSSKCLDKKIVQSATDIFAMTQMHLTSLKRQFPKAQARLLTEFSSIPSYRDQDIPDPIGGDREEFEETFRILADAIPRLIAALDRNA